MGLRLSTADAVARGLITQDDAEKINQASRGRPTLASLGLEASPPTPKLNAPQPNAAVQLAAAERENNEYPQRRLFESLCAALPGVPEWEREGLIPGRKYRADIFLPPSSIVIELDGFKFHRSLSAFKSDRMRSNLFTLYGYRMIHAFAKQVLDDAMLADLVELIVKAHNTPVTNAR